MKELGNTKKQLTVKDVGDSNKREIFRSILASSAISRNKISADTSLSIMTVKKVVDDLLQKKIITETRSDSEIGRKPKLLNVSEDLGTIVCIDLTSRSESTVIGYSIRGEMQMVNKYPFSRKLDFEANLFNFLAFVKSNFAKILGIGISVAGSYDKAADKVNNDLIHEYERINFYRLFSEYFSVGNVIIGHDVHMAASAEALVRGSIDNLLYFYAGAGVGSSFILNGTPYSGQNHAAGEIGKILVSEDQELEQAISVTALAERGEVADMDEFFQKYDRKDERIVNILDEACNIAARTIYNLIWILNPKIVVIGSSSSRYANILAVSARNLCESLRNSAIKVDFEISEAIVSGKSALFGLYLEVLEKFIETKVCDRPR